MKFVRPKGVLLAVFAALTAFPAVLPAQGWLPAGTWKGSFFREEDPKYQVHPVIATMDGTDRGILDYPTLGCRAELNAFKVGEESRPFYNARMITGGDRCGDDFAIFFNEDGTAEYSQFTKKPGFSAAVVTGVLKKQPPSRRARLAQYTAELRKNPPKGAPYLESRWKEMVELAASLNPRPAVPDEARELFRKANAHLGAYRYREAASDYHAALLLAPWLTDVYYNLAVALEAGGEGAAAARPLELYLVCAADKQEPETLAREVRQAATLLKARERKAAEERESYEKPLKEFILKVRKQRGELDREEERKKDEAASFTRDCSRDLTQWEYVPCTEREYELGEWYDSYDGFLKEHNRGANLLTTLRQMADDAYHREDYPKALRLWRPFAETGDSYAQFSLGWMFQHGEGVAEDLEEAAKWYRLGAEGGNDNAQFYLAAMYFTGKGIAKDLKTAFTWYRKSGEQGNVKAQLALGYILSSDYGIPQDMAEAVRWLKKAAEHDAQAQFTLGTMYHFGQGMTHDYREAAQWYRKAAEKDHASAQNNLAYMYENGEGVEKNLAEALKLYRRCSASGMEKCTSKVTELEKQ